MIHTRGACNATSLGPVKMNANSFPTIAQQRSRVLLDAVVRGVYVDSAPPSALPQIVSQVAIRNRSAILAGACNGHKQRHARSTFAAQNLAFAVGSLSLAQSQQMR